MSGIENDLFVTESSKPSSVDDNETERDKPSGMLIHYAKRESELYTKTA